MTPLPTSMHAGATQRWARAPLGGRPTLNPPVENLRPPRFTRARSTGGIGMWLVGLMLVSCVGCSSHSDRTRVVRSALDANQPAAALQDLNERLKVDSADDVPPELSAEHVLLLLDRSTILQQLERYDLSSRDLLLADKEIEMLDFSRSALDDIGRYMFSDDSGPYKAPAYEKLFINTLNMLNFLVVGDLSSARVEARRLAILQQYYNEHEPDAAALLGPGSYLAGFTFEKSREPDIALRYYDEALQHQDYPTLHDAIRRVAQQSSYRTPRIQAVLDAASTQGETIDDEGYGELLVVVNFGRVPAKEAKRIPIGLALTYASGLISPHNAGRANHLAAQGLVTWVNYPELGNPRGEWGQPHVAVQGKKALRCDTFPIYEEVRDAWAKARGAIVASAITRMISRVVAGEATRRVAGGGLAGALLSLGTQATLTAVDTPDTRSWATLPAYIALARVRLPAGTHVVDVGARGLRQQRRVEIRPGGWATATLTVLH